MKLTEKEKDLIEMIRNFRAARPNGLKKCNTIFFGYSKNH